MTKRRYKQGIDRQQEHLLPPKVEEYVSDDNPVRAIEAYVESLDLQELGFKNTTGSLTPGQPAYPPKALLKLYLYGYLHGLRSSRKLEQETQRNLEVIWLLEDLKPSYKTIADFRKDNLQALKATNRDFVQLCKELDLFGRELVGIDGSYFRGNVSKRSIYMKERLEQDLERIEKHIVEYLQGLETADQEEEGEKHEPSDLQEKLKKLRERQKRHQSRLKKLQESEQNQLAEVDKDARMLSKDGQSVAGYNVQTAVDDKHKLIVTHEVTQEGNDIHNLELMAKNVQVALEATKLQVTADSGYFNAVGIKNCLETGIIPFVPEPDWTRWIHLEGRFGREAFSYDAHANSYICPAGKKLTYSSKHNRNGRINFSYRSSVRQCVPCVLKKKCLPNKTSRRTIIRWEHEEVIEAHRERMKRTGREKMSQRASLNEHVFGTLKRWCGWTHFLMRGLDKVRAEMGLLVLAYNFRRVLTILGWEAFRDYCRWRAEKAALRC